MRDRRRRSDADTRDGIKALIKPLEDILGKLDSEEQALVSSLIEKEG